MGIQIGNNNKIKDSVITDNGTVEGKPEKKKFYERHPVMISIIISFVVGFVLLFSFWDGIIAWIESLL